METYGTIRRFGSYKKTYYSYKFVHEQPLYKERLFFNSKFCYFFVLVISRFGQNFVEKVANPKTMIQFHRQKIERSNDYKHGTWL